MARTASYVEAMGELALGVILAIGNDDHPSVSELLTEAARLGGRPGLIHVGVACAGAAHQRMPNGSPAGASPRVVASRGGVHPRTAEAALVFSLVGGGRIEQAMRMLDEAFERGHGEGVLNTLLKMSSDAILSKTVI